MKKLFTLLTLALLSIGTAWATDYTWTFDNYCTTNSISAGSNKNIPKSATTIVSTSNTNNLSYITGDNSESRIYNLSSAATVSEVNYNSYLYMGGSGSSAPGTGNLRYFTTGTISGKGTLTIVYAGTASGTCYIYDNTTSTSTGDALTSLTPTASTAVTSSVLDLGAGKELTICHGGKCYIYAILWKEQIIDEASPTIDTDLSTTPIAGTVGIGVPLSIVASHVTGYQWYRNTSASTSGATEITGATTASYTFIPTEADEATSVYLYCVATNDNATGTKTVTSAFAQVNVAAIPPLTAVTSKTWDFSNKTNWPNQTLTANFQNDNLKIMATSEKQVTITNTRVELGGGGNATARNISFKVAGKCRIFITFVSSSSTERTLNVDAGSFGTNIGSVSNNNTLRTKSVDYTDDVETTIYIYSTNGAIHVSKIQVEAPASVEVGGTGWATFVSDKALDFTGLAVKAYAVTGLNGAGTAVTLSDALTEVPANTPVLLNGAATTYEVPVIASASSIGTNKLVAGTGVAVSADGDNRYVLVNNGGTAEFQKIAGTSATVPVGKAYLDLAGGGGAPILSIDLNGDVTGIDAIQKQAVSGEFYNLNGQRVAQPTKGLYIVNGKKVVIK